MQQLISANLKHNFASELKAEYERVRSKYADRQGQSEHLDIAQSRSKRLQLSWGQHTPPAPPMIGLRVWEEYDLEQISRYIDWTPFFHTWELKKRYPQILDDPEKGEEARKLFQDAQELLQRSIREKKLTAKAVIGFFPANSIGDDVEVYADDTRQQVIATLHFLRQQQIKPSGKPNYCLADFIAPKEPGAKDYIGGFAVTTGIGADEFAAEFEKDHDDYNSIMVKALADRLAEAFAELMHERVRKEFWGYASDERLDSDALIKEEYTGIRPAPGYPACPDHTEKTTLFNLLNAEANCGITLTESLAMTPAAAVSGLYFSHPESRYFGVGKIYRDQVKDYARRKKMEIGEIERWLSPSLGYNP
jgi:5-methyltetrahydrofolate--homocysteine methyltransferase